MLKQHRQPSLLSKQAGCSGVVAAPLAFWSGGDSYLAIQNVRHTMSEVSRHRSECGIPHRLQVRTLPELSRTITDVHGVPAFHPLTRGVSSRIKSDPVNGALRPTGPNAQRPSSLIHLNNVPERSTGRRSGHPDAPVQPTHESILPTRPPRREPQWGRRNASSMPGDRSVTPSHPG